MEEGIFPGYQSMMEPQELEEERRLCYVGITRAKENLFLTCSKQRTVFGSTSYNQISRFINEIPSDLLDGYDTLDNSKADEFGDSGYKWEYGNGSKPNTHKSSYVFKYGSNDLGVAAKGFGLKNTIDTGNFNGNNGLQFKTAESFLNSLNNKKINAGADISKYKEGQRIYHKKFGEGIINKIEEEEEGEDYKLDISFDKAGHKRLMAKFANLEII